MKKNIKTKSKKDNLNKNKNKIKSSKKDNNINKKKVKEILVINRRLIFLLVIFIVIIVLLLIRIAYIQFVKGEEYKVKAFNQQTKTTFISPERGLIYDRNGKELAVNISVKTITINPNQVRNNTISIEILSKNISELLEIDEKNLIDKLNKKSVYEIIADKIDKEKAEELEKYLDTEKIIGFYFYDDSKRFYPEGRLTSHIIGFAGNSNQGLLGLEIALESYLKGIPGKTLTEKDSEGRELSFENYKRIDEKDGLNAVLTIDTNIQRMASDALDNAIIKHNVEDGASAIVMDPWTGEILAIVSKPDFDSNNPREKPIGYVGEWSGYTNEDVEYLYINEWKNRSIQVTYEPGSTFKAITAAAGLEENVINPLSIVNDNPVEIEDRIFNCWSKILHGQETFTEAVYNSCNPVFVNIAKDLGIEKFYNYMEAFGFYDKTGLEFLGETNSIIHKNPSIIDMASASFGQRFTVTPIQLISAYNALINGGDLLKPLLVKKMLDDNDNVVIDNNSKIIRKVISKRTSETLKGILEGVVSEGTGKNAYVRGYRVAGKTGTSETTNDDKVVVSFMAFAPADKPLISLLVVLNNPRAEGASGGSAAAPVVATLIEEILDYMNVERVYTKKDEELIAKEVFVPKTIDSIVKVATERIEKSGLKAIVIGNIEDENEIQKVVYQNPIQGESIPLNSSVVIYTSDKKEYVIMPDLEYKTVEESIKIIHDKGLNIKILGMGRSINQEIQKGTEIEIGTVIVVEFRYSSNIE